MLLPICLGIFLVGILIPNAFGNHGDIWYDIDEITEHTLIDNLTPGVKFPAPNFANAVYDSPHTYSFGDFKFSKGYILWLYFQSSQDFTTWNEYFSDGTFIQKSYGYNFGIYDTDSWKIVNAHNKDLLVFEIIAENESDNPLTLLFDYNRQELGFFMYDGNDREFTPVTNESQTGMERFIDPSFTWSEICPLYDRDFKIQPGISEKFKLCFEVPKDSDHFKIVYRDSRATADIVAGFLVSIFDREAMDKLDPLKSQPDLDYSEPTSTPTEFPYIIIALLAIGVVIGGIIVAILVAKKGSKPPTTVARTTWKQTTVLFCDSCGMQYRTDAKFCGKCGAPRS